MTTGRAGWDPRSPCARTPWVRVFQPELNASDSDRHVADCASSRTARSSRQNGGAGGPLLGMVALAGRLRCCRAGLVRGLAVPRRGAKAHGKVNDGRLVR